MSTRCRCWKTLIVLALAAGFLLSGFPAVYSQEVAESEGEKEVYKLEEIVVTAEKREESMLEVPVTMSAFSTDMINELGMTTKDDLEQLTPGLQFGGEGTKTGQGTVIRGMGSRNWGHTHANQAVAIYVDGIYQHSPTMAAANLFDLERVEVARGPQGTLHGRNSIGGAISFVTKGPTKEWDAEALVEFTDQVTQRYQLAFGGPINDWLRFRVTGGYLEGDGAQENVGPGPDQDAPELWNVRPQLELETGRFQINMRYEKTEDTGLSRIEQMMWQPRTDTPMLCFSWRPLDDPRAHDPNDELSNCEGWSNNTFYLDPVPVPAVEFCPGQEGSKCDKLQNKINSNREAREDTDRESFTFDVSFDLTETMSLRYTYGQSKLEQNYRADGDMTSRVPSAEMSWVPQDIVDRGLVDTFLAAEAWVHDSLFAAPYGTDESSHELVFTTDFDGPLNFIAGLYYYEDTADWHDDSWGFGETWRFTNADEAAQNVQYDGYLSVYYDLNTFEEITEAEFLALPEDERWEESSHVWSIVPGAGDYANCSEFINSPEMAEVLSQSEAAEEGRTVTCAPGSDHTSQYRSHSEADTSTKAAFASVEYRLNDQWNLSGGLRYTEDWNKHTRNSDDYTDAVYGVPLIFDLNIRPNQPEQSWNKIIWNASVEFTPADRHMFYGRVSTGYRAGGTAESTGLQVPVEEETVVNYELGSKGVYFNQRLQLTTAIFYNAYDGYQIDAEFIHPDYVVDENGFPPFGEPHWFEWWHNPLTNYTTNVDGTKIWGAEIQWVFSLTEALRISGFYSYLDSDLGTFSTILRSDPNPDIRYHYGYSWDDEPTLQWWAYPAPKDLSGGKLPQQPKHKWALTLAYDRPLGNLGWLNLLGTWSYTGERYSLVQNVDAFLIPSYDRLDLRATWTSPKGHWSASLYVQNALDEIGFIEYYAGFRPDWAWGATEAYPRGIMTDPRQIGFVLHWKL